MLGIKLDRIDKKIVGTATALLALSVFLIVDDRLLFKLAASVGENQKKVALVSFSSNDVRRRTETDLAWFPITGRDDVYQGDSIFTGTDSKAELALNGGSSIALDPESLVVIHITSSHARLDVKKGAVSGKVSGNQKIFLGSGAQATELSGKNAVVKVKVDETGKTQLKVLEGSAVVTDGGKPRTLTKNESQVLASVQLVKPEEIATPPPLLVAPPPSVDIRVAEVEKPSSPPPPSPKITPKVIPKRPQEKLAKLPAVPTLSTPTEVKGVLEEKAVKATPTPKLTPVLKARAQVAPPKPVVSAPSAPEPSSTPFAKLLPKRAPAAKRVEKPKSFPSPKPASKPLPSPSPSPSPAPSPSPSPSPSPTEEFEEAEAPRPEGISPRAGKIVHVYDKDSAESTLSWSKIDNAKLYRIELSKTKDFAKLERSEISTTEELKISDIPDGKLYWHVRSENEKATSNWSDAYTFTVKREPLTRNLASTQDLRPQTLTTAQIEELEEYKLFNPRFKIELGLGYSLDNSFGTNLPSGLQSTGSGGAITNGFLDMAFWPGGNDGRWGAGANLGVTYTSLNFGGLSATVFLPRASLEAKYRISTGGKLGFEVGLGGGFLRRYFVDTSSGVATASYFSPTYDLIGVASAFASLRPVGSNFELSFGGRLGKNIMDLNSVELMPEAGVQYHFKTRFTAGIKYKGTFERWPVTLTNKSTGIQSTATMYDMQNVGLVTFGVGF